MKHILTNLKGLLLLSAILIITLNTKAQTNQSEENINFNYSLTGTQTSANGTVVLRWVTSQEKNINYFGIERSFTGKDFTSVGLSLDGFENGSAKEYAFKDISKLLADKDVVYYRLKQFDVDGKVSYGSVLTVTNKSVSKTDKQVSQNSFAYCLN